MFRSQQTSKQKNSVQFNCFSPPVMVASFIAETVLAVYTLWRYKLNVLGRLVLMTLLALAFFQLCEYRVCRGFGFEASVWSRAGYASITLLPVLGLHILHVLAEKPERRLVRFAYVTMAAFVVYFLLVPSVFNGYACTGNYVIFQIGKYPALAYMTYYYGWLLTAIILGARWIRRFKVSGKKLRNHIFAIQGLIIGYLVFLMPTALANSVKPSTRSGIPSIMCGFAVLFAFILVGFILPRRGEQRHKH